MNFVGKSVYTIWGGGILRFGRVAEEKMSGNWKYVRVDWAPCSAHEKATEWKGELRNLKYPHANLEWCRIDKIVSFEPHEMTATITKLTTGVVANGPNN